MGRFSSRVKNSALLAAAVVAGTVGVMNASAEDIWIKSEVVEVRSGKGAVYPVVGTVKKGDKLSVVAREGKWIKVKAGDKEGYVFETAVSEKKVDGGGNPLAGLSGGASMTSASAAKGLEQDTEAYAKERGMDPKPLQSLVDAAKAMNPAEWEAFAKEGNVGPYAPSK